MEWILWLCLLTFLISSTWAAFRISRRFLREDLPPIVTLVFLDHVENADDILAALSLQFFLTDPVAESVWLVDRTKNGQLNPLCTEFCKSHTGFFYCQGANFEKIIGNIQNSQKNDCNLPKKKGIIVEDAL